MDTAEFEESFDPELRGKGWVTKWGEAPVTSLFFNNITFRANEFYHT